jgi:hypothetical protein
MSKNKRAKIEQPKPAADDGVPECHLTVSVTLNFHIAGTVHPLERNRDFSELDADDVEQIVAGGTDAFLRILKKREWIGDAERKPRNYPLRSSMKGNLIPHTEHVVIGQPK